ncbi:hypothetical protein DS831_05965 [Bombilactobacillus bombi]|uniref:DUF968 domain-containing protein n=1 Tax=Bombilactobacillus bombi TaxID=1303590 RepID=A0A3R6ZBN5_9LACO|nr:putative HNHc nuclease [Bombilactobacillus bombi]RHW49707.1 hypothetical protein DS831_05965 [Bombilactobacillus bombi]
MFGKLKSIKGNEIILEVDDLDTYKIDRYANHQKPTVEVNIADNREISPDQRKKIYAIIGDIANYTGYSIPKEMPAVMKWQYLIDTGAEMFSLADCSMTQANNYLKWLIDFCFDNDIPFKTRTWDLLPNDYAMVVRCCHHRKCIICGRHVDIDHTFGLVGMGRNRRWVDNSSSYFLPLCREHHVERHTLGVYGFLDKYHIKPVKLNAQTRKDLRIGK